jgi:hypothetical protein
MADVCISTVADRHALHFIYYSSVKKTVFALTKRVFAPRKSALVSFAIASAQRDAAYTRSAHEDRAQSTQYKKHR